MAFSLYFKTDSSIIVCMHTFIDNILDHLSEKGLDPTNYVVPAEELAFFFK
jgi:hypothetical protein